MTDHDDIEPAHTSSATDLVLNELQLFGYRLLDDQPDPRSLPEGKTIAGAIADIFDALVATLSETRLEPDLEDDVGTEGRKDCPDQDLSPGHGFDDPKEVKNQEKGGEEEAEAF